MCLRHLVDPRSVQETACGIINDSTFTALLSLINTCPAHRDLVVQCVLIYIQQTHNSRPDKVSGRCTFCTFRRLVNSGVSRNFTISIQKWTLFFWGVKVTLKFEYILEMSLPWVWYLWSLLIHSQNSSTVSSKCGVLNRSVLRARFKIFRLNEIDKRDNVFQVLSRLTRLFMMLSRQYSTYRWSVCLFWPENCCVFWRF